MADMTRARVTLDEFRALPESLDHIELIDRELIVSPTPKYKHQSVVFNGATELKQKIPEGTVVIAPMDVYLDDENVVEPDVFWVSGADSRCKLGADGYWHGVPDLVVEVLSPSTALRDHGVKFGLYERYGTCEYWLIDPDAEFVEVFRREGEAFKRFGVFGRGDSIALSVLTNAMVPVAALFA